MRLHEFVCQDCGMEFEELVNESLEIYCPKCNGKNTKKLVSAVKTSQANSSSGENNSACVPGSGFS